MIFSDETWATTDPMWKQWATVHDTEDPESFALLRRKPHGWMFWGAFAGGIKGPGFVWEKEWGGIDTAKYLFFILPMIVAFFREHRLSLFQHDNAPAHKARETRLTLELLRVPVLRWPAYSPDLNPIENVWFWMKDWVESHFDVQSLEPMELRAAVWAAWEAVPGEWLKQLAHSMPRRLQLVIERNGESIKY